MSTVAERYVELGLRLGRLDDGVVDAYIGPPEIAAAVEAEPVAEAASLVAAADELLGELGDGWLRDQVLGLRTCAGGLAGETRSYADEVEGRYGVRPTWTSEDVFAAAHEQLDELLPGDGPLLGRLEGWRDSNLVPTELVERIVAAAIDVARERTQDLVDLPDGEGVELVGVRNEPWDAYNHYLGDYRGRISVNLDLPRSAIDLLHLTLHETYPGHQAERSCKEDRLVRGQGLLEESIVLEPTPASLVSEGIGEIAPDLLHGEGGEALARVMYEAGVTFDLAHALAVDRATEPCRWVEVNAALMLHDEEASADDVRAYVTRWALLPPEIVDHLIRFVTEPTSRTYVVNYPAGRDLCRAYVAGDPDRFRRLLTEQVRVRDLIDAAQS